MKRSVFSLVFMFVSLATVTPASAQIISLRQNVWLHGTPVTVFNASDGSFKIFVDDNEAGIIGPGGRWSINFGGGLFVFQNSQQVINFGLSAQVCSDAYMGEITNNPPYWAADSGLLGGLAITNSYLATAPGIKDLRKRVDKIKKQLDDRPGGGPMKKELDRWRKVVEQLGYFRRDAVCEGGDVEGVRVQLQLDSYNHYRRSVTLYLRGDKQSGYRFDDPSRHAY